MRELEDQLDRAGHDPKVRAVVLTGAGTVFCSGMDLKEAARERDGAEAEQDAVATLQEYADLVQKLHTLPKPTIAAINGDALAGGAGLMTACDFAVASEAARIGYPEVLRGLVPAIVMYDLTRLIGDRRARQLLLTGELIMSTQAYDWGLVNQVTTPDRCLPEAIRVGKDMMHIGTPGGRRHQAAARRDPGPAHEPARSRRRERGDPRLRRGPGRHPRLPGEAAAAMGGDAFVRTI